jgi:heptosyltransferase II
VKSETILVRLPNWIGDVIMATPTLRALRDSFPRSRILALGKPWAVDLLLGHPAVDEIIPFPFQNGKPKLNSTLWLIRTIKSRNPDWGFIFPNSFGSALLFFLAKVPRRIGYRTNRRGRLLTHAIDLPQTQVHQLDSFLNLMKGFSIEKKWDQSLYLPVTPAKKEEGDALWRSWGIQADDVVIGLNPGAAWGPSKRWFPEYFAATADLFQQKTGIKIVIFGGPEDQSLAQEIANKMHTPPLIVAGKDNLRVLPALLLRCNLFITNDTGPMHIAASQKVPQVVLFGPTDPLHTAYRNASTRVIQKELDCAPCFKRVCPFGHHNCMATILPNQVVDAGIELLNGSPE